MSEADFLYLDYKPEEQVQALAGGALWRALSPAQNAGKGRRDLIYQAQPHLAHDINAVDRLRAQLERCGGLFHPNILACLGAHYSRDQLLVVSEFLPGATLAEMLAEMPGTQKRLPVPAAIYLACELAKALCHAQNCGGTGSDAGLSHTQLRPENVFLGFNGMVKLLPFEIAALESCALAATRGFRESAASYASPEQATGRELDGRSDFFSLGVVLWELLCGRPLYPSGVSMSEWLRVLAEKDPPPPSELNPEVPAELDTVVRKLLDRDLFLRYELGEKAARDLDAVLKFRFPDFTTGEFRGILAAGLARVRDRYQASLDLPDATNEATRQMEIAPKERGEQAAHGRRSLSVVVESCPAGPAPAAHPGAASPLPRTQKPAIFEPAASPPSGEGEPVLSFSTVRWLIACGTTLLLILPFAAPRLLKKHAPAGGTLSHRSLPASTTDRSGTLHIVSSQRGYELLINGKPARIEDDRVDVPADVELEVRAKLEGYGDIVTTTQVSPGEDLDLPLQFRAEETGSP